MRSYRTPRLRKRNPLDRKVPGVLIRPDRQAPPEPDGHEWSSWQGSTRRHYRPNAGRGAALCGRTPGSLVLGSQLRQWALSRPLCGRCVVLATKRGLEVPAA
jgi:hypothetical protein